VGGRGGEGELDMAGQVKFTACFAIFCAESLLLQERKSALFEPGCPQVFITSTTTEHVPRAFFSFFKRISQRVDSFPCSN
jgi:hypothetical protein